MSEATTSPRGELRDVLMNQTRALLPSAEEHPDFGTFSPWIALGSPHDVLKRTVGGADYSLASFVGVYLVASFPNQVPTQGPADPFDPHVVYIDRTRTKALAARWKSLARGIERHRGHSGGNTLHNELLRLGILRPGAASRFHVAALPVWVTAVPADPADASRLRPDPRQISFRTAAIEALLIEAVSNGRRRLGSPLANEPSLINEPRGKFRLT